MELLVILGLLLAPVTAGLDCPRGFGSMLVDGVEKCYVLYLTASYGEGVRRCRDRLSVESRYSVLSQGADYFENRTWVDAVRSYEGGPFVSWGIRGGRVGEPILSPEIWESDGGGECLEYDLGRRNYSVQECSKVQQIVCLVDHYADQLKREGCNANFYYLATPTPICLTMMVAKYAPKRISSRVCTTNNSTLVMDGWIHTKNKFLTKGKQYYSGIPTNIQATTDGYYCGNKTCKTRFFYKGSKPPMIDVKTPIWIDRDDVYNFDRHDQVFGQFFCEHPISKVDKIVLFKSDSYLVATTENGMGMEDVLCYTDSETYYPVPVKTNKMDRLSLRLEAIHNGYYWCVSNSSRDLVDQSERVLWIGDESLARDTEVIFVSLRRYVWSRALKKIAERFMFGMIKSHLETHWKWNIKKVAKELFGTNILPPYTYKVFTDGSLLIYMNMSEILFEDARVPGPKQNFQFVYHKIDGNCGSDFRWKYQIKKKSLNEMHYTFTKTMKKNCFRVPKTSTSVITNSVTPSTVDSTTEDPTTESTTTEDPTTEFPIIEAQTTEEFTMEIPTTDDPTTEFPIIEAQTSEEFTMEIPTPEVLYAEIPETNTKEFSTQFSPIESTFSLDIFTPTDVAPVPSIFTFEFIKSLILKASSMDYIILLIVLVFVASLTILCGIITCCRKPKDPNPDRQSIHLETHCDNLEKYD